MIKWPKFGLINLIDKDYDKLTDVLHYMYM